MIAQRDLFEVARGNTIVTPAALEDFLECVKKEQATGAAIGGAHDLAIECEFDDPDGRSMAGLYQDERNEYDMVAAQNA